MHGGLGWDSLDGGAGNDALFGAWGQDNLVGGAGDDALDGGQMNDTLSGEAGVDTLNGGAGNDLLLGGAEADFLDGGEGNDTLDGGDAYDYLISSAGADLMRGGAGGDYYDLFFDSMGAGTVIEDTTTVDERGPWDDNVWINQADGRLSVVFDGDGAAEITGGGLDGAIETQGIYSFLQYDGVGGVDLDARDDTVGVRFTALGDEGDDTLLGGAGNDDLTASSDSWEGADFVDGGAGDDSLAGSGTILGGLGDDQIYGVGTVSGGEGNDFIEGLGDLSGDDGNDTIWTNDWYDTPTTLTGGAGTDTFWIDLGFYPTGGEPATFEVAHITDFEEGETIRLSVLKFEDDPDPEILIEEDPEANEVRIFVEGNPYLVIDGVSTLPAGALDITIPTYGSGS